MDTKGWIVVVLCAIGMVLYFPIMTRNMERSRPQPPATATEGGLEAGKPGSPGIADATGPASPAKTPADGAAMPDGGISEPVKEQLAELTSSKVRFKFTSLGGGIARAELLDHAESLGSDESIAVNSHGSYPVGMLDEGAGDESVTGFEVVLKNEAEVVFEGVKADGLRVRKRYSINGEEKSDGYVVNLELTLKNEGVQNYQRSDFFLYTGSVAPLHPKEWPQQTGMFWRDEGTMHFRDVNYFGKKAFAGMQFRGAKPIAVEETASLEWAGVMDQFYAIVIYDLNPSMAPGAIWARRIPVQLKGQVEPPKKALYAAEGGFGLPEVRLNPGEEATFRYEIYLGPKEYARLYNLGGNIHEIMNYGSFPVLGRVVAPVSRFLVRSLEFLKGKVGNYGIAIILITFCIRVLIWPLHAKSTRTMKRMAALSPKMTEMREKYKDDPQTLNQEMMKLYREYGVNPMGGCLPVFLQLPIFLGFYRMLQSAVELRHEGFLWVDDLSMPDTLFTIPIMGGLPFNVLPLLMGATMLLQMKVAPKTGDKTQQRIFMFMPLIFLFICYNFASALALYWTAQNIFSIGQTYYMSRIPEPLLEKKKVKTGSFSDLMSKAKDRTKVDGQGPQQTASKKDKKKKRK